MYEETDLSQRLLKRQKQPLHKTVGGVLSILGGGKPPVDQEDDLASKLQYEILKRDLTRNPLDDQLKQAQIGAYESMASSPVPEGFVRVGNKIQQDPTFKTPTPLNEAQQFELEQKQRANENQATLVKNSAQNMLDTVEEVKKGMGYFGPLGRVPSIPFLTGDYGKRKNWETNVERLRSGKILDVMNELKSASRTGATGFGQLSNKELGVLESAATALRRDLAPEDAERYLTDLETPARMILGLPIKPRGPQLPPTPGQKTDYKSKYGLD